jgi:hypothetical protein
MRLRCPLRHRLAICVLLLLFSVVLGVPALFAQAPSPATGVFVSGKLSTSFTCNQTFSNSTGLVAAIGSAANGSTICLNNGSYGTLTLTNVARSGYVTIRSTTGIGATVGATISNSDFIRFQSVTMSNFVAQSCSTNLEILDTTFTVNGNGAYFNGADCELTVMNFLVDNSTFIQVGQSGNEGRLSCRYCNTATFSNNLLQGIVSSSNASDGINLDNGRNVTVEQNLFTGIAEALCGATHCDAIQLQGAGRSGAGIIIRKNYFEDGDTFIMAPDGSTDVVADDNIFDGTGNAYPDKIQFGEGIGAPRFRHNTLVDIRASFDSKTGSPGSANWIVENNALQEVNSATVAGWKTANGGGCISCTFRYTLVDTDADNTGTNNVVGTAIYVGGGTSPAMGTGWTLAGGSPGKAAGNDGADMGSRYFGPYGPQ